MIRQLERPFLHPLLFAVYPIIFIYAEHQDELTPRLAIAPIILVLFLALFVLGVSNLVLRDRWKAGFFTTVFMLLFFFFNQLIVLFNSMSDFQIYRGRYKLLLFVCFLLIFFGLLWRSKRSFLPVTPALNAAALSLLGFNLIIIVSASIATSSRLPVAPEGESASIARTGPAPPDIYYVILDGYANSRTLREVVGYDNTSFEDFLRNQGFFVVPDAYANYYQTNLSLPSSLNMTLLEPSKDFIIPLRSASDTRLNQFLRKHGYRFVNPSKDWKNPNLSSDDDESVGLGDFFRSDFALTLARFSMLDPIMNRMQWYSESVRREVLYVLKKFREAPDLDLGGPKFSFIYLLPPHPPYVFGPNGEDMGQVDLGKAFDVRLSSWDNHPAYINQVEFVNNQLMEIIPEILAKYPADDPPVIVIQGDHGPTFTRSNQSDADYYRMRLGILNAYLLPRGVDSQLYDEITPVNTFPLILREYLGEDVPPLADRSYFSLFETPFDLLDVTKSIRGEDSRAQAP